MENLNLEQLQGRENDLRGALESELGSSQLDLVNELVEVSIEIEQESNK